MYEVCCVQSTVQCVVSLSLAAVFPGTMVTRGNCCHCCRPCTSTGCCCRPSTSTGCCCRPGTNTGHFCRVVTNTGICCMPCTNTGFFSCSVTSTYLGSRSATNTDAGHLPTFASAATQLSTYGTLLQLSLVACLVISSSSGRIFGCGRLPTTCNNLDYRKNCDIIVTSRDYNCDYTRDYC